MFGLKNKQKGFTLVELLVVIAIIGILSAVVLASLNSARQKGRDAKRVGDMGQIKIALELMFDDTGSYPATLAGLVPTYLPVLPVAPAPGAYAYVIPTGGLSYHLGATLEVNSQTGALGGDADCSSLAATFCRGFTAAVTGGFAGTDPVYDLVP